MKRHHIRQRPPTWMPILALALVGIMLLAACDDSGSNAYPTPDPASLPGDPSAGALIYDREGCAGCHAIDSDARRTGPSLQKIGGVASTRVKNQSAEDYLRAALLDPNEYVVKNFSGIMPAYDSLTQTDLNNLIAFLMALTG